MKKENIEKLYNLFWIFIFGCVAGWVIEGLWITLKLLTAGIPEEEHHKYVKDIEDILDTYFSELVGTKCSIIIVTDSKSRAKVRQSDVIGHRNNCYIIKRRETPKDGK